jgi:hypothetical protein
MECEDFEFTKRFSCAQEEEDEEEMEHVVAAKTVRCVSSADTPRCNYGLVPLHQA